MNRRHLLIIMTLVMATAAVALGVHPVFAGPGTLATPPAPDYPASATPSGGTFFANSPLGNWQYVNALGTYSSAVSNSGTPLRKFVDSLPGLGAANANNLGQYIPIAAPDTTLFPGSDYYEIGLREYRTRMHSDLPQTTDALGIGTRLRGYYQKNGTDTSNQYLGPLIIATKNRPVRIKFFNELGIGAAGDLPLPVDTTYMGAGMGPLGLVGGNYTQNRATLHLHGGHTPWISDGTPHQWITPAGETSPYLKGLSQQNVPDMDGGIEPQGAATFFWTNNQSGRFMFYHDHAYGLTRLNVYAGEAAGYLIVDPVEEDSLAAAGVPGTLGTTPDLAHLIPLVIQDKTFVPQDAAVQDAKWTNPNWGTYGDLWFPHVYETNQWPDNPDLSGANNFGRWDYGPWFWPIFPAQVPGLPTFDVSGVPEAFMDTPVINGTAYPYVDVQPTAYRLRILNACNDRYVNLSLFTADTTVPVGPSGTYSEVKMVDAVPRPACSATVTTNCTCSATSAPAGCFPDTWPTDGRPGGVPDPATVGPSLIQIGTEGGLLPAPAVIAPQPVNYVYNRRNIIVLDISDTALLLGPAERADVIVDFSAYAGQTVILYNDSPAPNPGFDPRFDYYTGDPDQTWMGGAPSTMPGYGPNTRTIMQFRVAAAAPAPFDQTALNANLPAIYVTSQPAPVVPQTGYPAPYNATSDTYARIQDNFLTFTPVGSTTPVTMQMLSKAIAEEFDFVYGRMNATLGTELPFTNFQIQTTIPLMYIDPATEMVADGQPQLWRITHNGVDTHAIHFHLFDVQLVNRIGWDGALYLPDPNELGWKDTVKMHPLEDIVVALRPTQPPVPFAVPNSVRPLDVTMPLGTSAQFTNIDPYTNNPITVTNDMTNFGWEYVWHCHLLGHEENDMMRPVGLAIAPAAPSNLVAAGLSGPLRVNLTWTDNSNNETNFTIQRATDSGFTTGLTTFTVGANVTAYTNTTVVQNVTYYYRVIANNVVGTPVVGTTSADSAPSNAVTVGPPAAAPSIQSAGQPSTALNAPVALGWKDNSPNVPNPPNFNAERSFTVQRSTNGGGTWINVATLPAHAGTGAMTYTDPTTGPNGVKRHTTYTYRILANNIFGSSASNTITFTTR